MTNYSLMPHLRIESDAVLEALGIAVAPNQILREDPEAINEPPENSNVQDRTGLVPGPSAEQGTS